MTQINLVVLLVDIDNNFVTINGDSFLSTKIDDSLNSAQRVASVVKLLKDKIDLDINTSRLKKLEESTSGKLDDEITIIYMYKLDVAEKAKLVPVKIVSFYHINGLPVLNILSSSIARLITSNYVVYLRRVPNPPTIVFTYPSNVVLYNPRVAAPVLVPFRRSSPRESNPIRDAPVISRVKSEEKKNSPNQRSVGSEVNSALKKESTPKRESKRASRRASRKESPTESRIESKRGSSLRRSSRKKGGDYYEKYVKYKAKYLALKKQGILPQS